MTTELASPANASTTPASRTRVPMSTPQQKLSVPEIPGHYLYWMRGTAERLAKAAQAGYEFVTSSETAIANFSLGGDAKTDGSTDMGTRVSVLAGGDEDGGDGQPLRLYLMKIKEEWHQEDLAVQGEASENLRRALQAGKIGVENEAFPDRNQRYVGQQTSPNMFQPKPIRRG